MRGKKENQKKKQVTWTIIINKYYYNSNHALTGAHGTALMVIQEKNSHTRLNKEMKITCC